MTTLEAGAILHGTYRLVAPLGRGGMGTVWRAEHARLPRPVAIKVLNPSAYESEELLHRFRREAEVTSQLGHPHIVEVFDFNVLDDGQAYLVMELLRGESLRQRLERGPMSPDDSIELLRQMGSALATAHRAGIIHRDLKPENVFLCEGERMHAKILDFGISKIQGSLTVVTRDDALLGTPKYMSPEQAKGENAELDPRTDQFSLGAIAYEMLTGHPAFSGASVTAVLYKVLHEDPPPAHEVSGTVTPELDSAIRRALAKEKEARFSSIEAFVEAMTTARSSRSPMAAASTTSGPPLRPAEVGGAPGGGSTTAPAGDRTEGPRWPLGAAVLASGLALGVGGVAWLARGPAVVVRAVAEDGGRESRDASTEEVRASTASSDDAGASLDGAVAVAEPREGGDGSSPSPRAEAPSNRRPRPVRPPPRTEHRLGPNLRRAREAVERAAWDEAIRWARRGLSEGEGDRAYALMTVASCGKKDLAAAKAMLRRVPRSQRAQVRRTCRELGRPLN